MSQQQHIPQYTITDYRLWEGDWELIYGYPHAMAPSPVRKHQVLGRRFIVELEKALQKSCGEDCNCEVLYEIDWIIDENTVVRPDVAILCNADPGHQYIQVPPALIVEIFSPHTRLKDRNTKFSLYQQQGVRYYIMADPEVETWEIFELQNNRYTQIDPGQPLQLHHHCTINLDEAGIFIPSKK